MGSRKSRSGSGSVKGARNKSNRAFILAIAAVAVVGLSALGYAYSKSSTPNGSTQVDTTLPAVTSNGYVIGAATAPVEVTEFGDFECPVCAEFNAVTEPDVRGLVSAGKIRFRYIAFPLQMHPNAWPAARAAACADEQGKFWEMHDLLFTNQDKWNGEATNKPQKVFKQLAGGVQGLDQDKFGKCVDNPNETQAQIQAQEKLGIDHKVGGTPTFVFGSRQVGHPVSFEEFRAYVDSAAADADTSKKKGAPKK